MPKNTELTTALKETQVLQIIQMVLEGSTQAKACRKAGIHPSTYRRYLQQHPDTIDIVRKLIVNTEKVNLAEIVSARTSLITGLIAKASAANDITEIIAADKHLAIIQGELEARVGVSAKGDEIAEEFLGNPEFQPVESRFIPADTINLKPKDDGSVDVTIKRQAEIIDAKSSDED